MSGACSNPPGAVTTPAGGLRPRPLMTQAALLSSPIAGTGSTGIKIAPKLSYHDAIGAKEKQQCATGPPKRVKGSTWTRTGCVTCKRRRKKCDEAKPGCGNCARLRLTCEGYDALWAAPLSSGENRPRKRSRVKIEHSIVWNNPDGVVVSPGDLSSRGISDSRKDTNGIEVQAQEDIHDRHDDYPVYRASSDTSLIVPSSSILGGGANLSGLRRPLSSSDLSQTELYLLQYHIERLCRVLVMHDDQSSNPLRALMVPKALSSPLIRNALCAVSACHLSGHLGGANGTAENAEMMMKAVGYYTKALNGLNTVLSSEGANSAMAPSDDVVVTAAFLCKYEIVKGSVRQWRRHLDGLERLVQMKGGVSRMGELSGRFVHSFMTYHRNIANITDLKGWGSHHKGPFVGDMGKRLPSDSRNIDSYMGFTEDLVRLFARISQLQSLDLNDLSQLETLYSEIDAISVEIEVWSLDGNPTLTHLDLPRIGLDQLSNIAAIFRNAALIYLQSTLEVLDKELPSWGSRATPAVAVPSLRAVPPSPVVKAQAITTCLVGIDRIPAGNPSESALVLPIFLCGVETEKTLEYRAARGRLQALGRNIGIGNIGRAREVLTRVWEHNGNGTGTFRTTKRDWRGVLQELGWDLILT